MRVESRRFQSADALSDEVPINPRSPQHANARPAHRHRNRNTPPNQPHNRLRERLVATSQTMGVRGSTSCNWRAAPSAPGSDRAPHRRAHHVVTRVT